MYRVSPKHPVLSTPFGYWEGGQPFNRPPNLPTELFQQWIKAGVIVVDQAGPDTMELDDETDFLSKYDRPMLLAFIRNNGLHKASQTNPIKPMSNWSDQQVAQAIRDFCPDYETLPRPDQTAELETPNASPAS